MRIVDIFKKINVQGGAFLIGLFRIFGVLETIGAPLCAFCFKNQTVSVCTIKGVNAAGKKISLPACNFHKREASLALSWTAQHLRIFHLLDKWSVHESYHL